MHAGEALWNLYTLLAGLERKYGKDSDTVRAIGVGQDSCRVLSEHLQVPAPTAQQLELRLAQLLPQRIPSSQGDGSDSGREALDHCAFILENKDDVPESAAEFAESIAAKAASMQESVRKYNSATPRMLDALRNMRAGLERVLEHKDRDE